MNSRSGTGLCLIAAALLGAPVSHGQILTRIPPAAPKTPEYVPPPPPPPPAEPPARPEMKPGEPDKSLPSLIQKDEHGKIKPIEGSLDEAAIAAMNLDAETRKKIAASLAGRAGEIEKSVIERLDKALEARRVRATLADLKNLNQLMAVRDAAQPLITERALDRLLHDGAINATQRQQAEQMITAYQTALREERSSQTGTDMMKIGAYVARDGFDELAGDSLAALDRMLARAAPRIEQLLGELDLDASQRAKADAAKAGLPPITDAGPRRLEVARSIFFDILQLDQQRALLRKTLPAP